MTQNRYYTFKVFYLIAGRVNSALEVGTLPETILFQTNVGHPLPETFKTYTECK